jgi:hypothetical protein
MTFLMKTSETKKVAKIFVRHFLLLKIFCFNHPGFIFILTKKGFSNSQAVRIRVNLSVACCGLFRPLLELPLVSGVCMCHCQFLHDNKFAQKAPALVL